MWIRTAKIIDLKPNQPSTKLFINQAKSHNCYNALLYDGFLFTKKMGYYTRHELSIISGDDYNTDYEQEITESTDYSSLFDDSIKWYDCEKDMKKYSKKHPNVIFCIDGEGEENGDIWKAYFQNGKIFKTKAVFTFEEFSIDKLE